MNEERHPKSIKATRYHRVGSLPGCIYLAAPDIGQAALPDGREVYCTWGRNLTREQAGLFHDRGLNVETVILGADDGSCEVVIPDQIARKWLPMLTK